MGIKRKEERSKKKVDARQTEGERGTGKTRWYAGTEIHI
jgi:hypothetical protein